jgi:hypothetical protein
LGESALGPDVCAFAVDLPGPEVWAGAGLVVVEVDAAQAIPGITGARRIKVARRRSPLRGNG